VHKNKNPPFARTALEIENLLSHNSESYDLPTLTVKVECTSETSMDM